VVPAAALSSSSFSEAASMANTDKLAVLMALFKNKNMQPPPLPELPGLGGLPMFDSFDDMAPKLEMPGAAAAATETAAPAAAEPSQSERESAEVAQLIQLFSHARGKVLKLSRLYQSNVLQGAGGAQALQKLGGLTRAYFAFTRQAQKHAHIEAAMAADEDIRDDMACDSLQHLSDRLYKQAKAS